MAHDWASDRDLLIEAAHAAGEIALRHFGSDLAVVEKPEGQGPVTVADRVTDSFLAEVLRDARPDYGWLSEESEDNAERLATERVFIVDPIDGTRAFIAGETGWCVAAAVVEAGRSVAGVVHLPARGETYAATLGAGATLDGRPLRVSARTSLSGAEVLASKAQLSPHHWPGGVPDIQRIFRPSLARRFCLVAQGRFDAMLTLRDSWEWDLAAGALIAAEAGAAVTDRDGAPLRFNARTPLAPGVIVAPPALHAALIIRRGIDGAR